MSKCRSCGREILWRRTRGGRNMPIDPEPRDDGNVQIALVGGEEIALTVSGDFQEAARIDGQPLYVSHFATCPNANQHRRSR